LRQLEVDDLPEEAVGHLDQDAGAVTGVGFPAAGPPVFEVEQRSESLAHDAVIAAAGEVGHESHAAGVMLVGGVVQTGCRTSTLSRIRPCRQVGSGHKHLPSSRLG
jgi:hypothetical protein